jgi:hypothetical protein
MFDFSYEDEYNEDTDESVYDECWFELKGISDEHEKSEELAETIMENETYDIEMEYGVHDFSTSDDITWIGYTTYEVPKDKTDEVMNKWKAVFERYGLEVGELHRKRIVER